MGQVTALIRGGLHNMRNRIQVAFEAFVLSCIYIPSFGQRNQVIHVKEVCP